MRWCLLFTVLFVFPVWETAAQAETEKDLVYEIVTNLQTGDDSSYSAQFPTFDLLSQQVYGIAPKDSFQLERIARLRNNIHHLRQFDPAYNPKILGMMHFARNKASDSGIHWGDITIAKYELDKQRLPYELIGFELIAPIRMNGYIFIRDELTRIRYGIAVRDIFLVNGKWYGGMVLNILEASNMAEYEEALMIEEKEMRKLMIAKQNGTLDSILAIKDSIRKAKTIAAGVKEEDEGGRTMYKEIVDRKVYSGYFDKQLEVVLYVRFLKGACPETICDWEAMYWIEGMENYAVLEVERREDGTYVFTEEDMGIMELKLTGNTFTGNWISYSDKTEYEAYLKEKDGLKQKRLLKLDQTYEEILWR